MTHTIAAAKYSGDLTELVKLVDKGKKKFDEYVITVDGKPKAIVMSMDEYESWQETMEILSDPKLVKELKEAEEEIDKGNYITWEELKKDLNSNV